MIKCLMLDVDGVLINGRPSDGLPWITSLEADLGINPVDLQEQFFARVWKDVIIGKRALRLTLSECMPEISDSVSVDKLINYWFEQDSHINMKLLNDCEDARLAGLTIFLATNQERERANYLMENLGLKNHVDGIIYSGELGFLKEDPQFFAKAEAIAGYPPENLLLIDDTLINIETAINSGWSALHWTDDCDLVEILR